MTSLKIDYNINKSELCEIGRQYDTDKSAFRNNVTKYRHCHPYSLFYDSLFSRRRHDKLNIAEIGLLHGSSVLMWRDYFLNANIYCLEYYDELIRNFKNNFNTDRIHLSTIDVTNNINIKEAFNNINEQFDIIIDDSTHQFEDQIRIIENAYKHLKPGGLFIIENIFKSYDESDYINRLKPILNDNFQDYYFIELDHINRCSIGWDNDKLFVLVKSGEEPLFKNNNKLTIITPSYRLDNLLRLKNSIDFDYVDQWIIVYDGSKINENPNLFQTDINKEKIEEYLFKGNGISGNPQRNYALDQIKNTNTFIYYLDDDNIIHPSLYKLLNVIDKNKIYTFNQENGIKGNNINVNCIDTAMFLIDFNLCKNIRWSPNYYNADGFYIKECYENNKENHIFVDNELCYYNKI